ncbi:heterokaryon incompatibility protein-domain-containing protein [Aspergillus alliaceus]|uniref:heterokaryon incompatibility protein-domain-containing protein n=1 Tax=Petromyces alliaceus TaxID=209559 RepID=UPI0012A3CB62|nr:heterokaryon incompatibility protein-domain-containing protein [Aspergillus alliaceus]KAB8229406.1 heterokaryon incompatibility protein-domain-containing protein [Aspergillus alliaceus]
MSQYNYSPLLVGPSMIRVLCLLPNEDNTASIECQLITYTLPTGKGHHPYEALSYVWGSESKPQCIFIDGHSLPIDAIYINQQDDLEKACQIQSILAIYGQASHVIVWLGETADHSDRALENIRVPAEDEPFTDKSTILWGKKTNHDAILMLLQRPWFRRIWVLQEVSAARSILVMCGPVKMNGYTFSLGLNGLNLTYEAHPGLESLIRSITYFMRGAIFRPEYTTRLHRVMSLGELMDMYHTREATRKHDKVYALLGMSSDDPNTADLLPDYGLPWDALFQRVITWILTENHAVETWPHREIAVIKAQGYILGRVNSVKDDTSRYDRQCVQISFNTTPRSLSYENEWGTQWLLQASAKPIQEGDILCLLQGALKPSIVTIYEDYFSIKMISVTPHQKREGGSMHRALQNVLHLQKEPLRDILLVWSWEAFQAHSGKENESEPLMRFNDTVPSDAAIVSENKRLNGLALILEDIVTIALRLGPRMIMDLLLEQRGKSLPISEAVVEIAAGNTAWGGEMLKWLLKQRGKGLPISRAVVQIAAGNTAWGGDILKRLLKQRGKSLPITEDVVRIAAGNPRQGYWILKQLLEEIGKSLPISEDVVKIAAGNTGQGYWIMELLLQQRGKSLPAPGDVFQVVAGNTKWGGEMLKQLLERNALYD